MHADEPINQDGPHVLIDVSLLAHVEAVRLRLLLCCLHVLLNVVAIEANVIDVGEG